MKYPLVQNSSAGPLCIIMEENLAQAYPETQWWLCSLGDIFFYMLTRIELGRALFWFTHTTKCSFCCCSARTCNLCYLLSVPWNFLKTHSLCCVLQFNINLNNSRRLAVNYFLSVLNNAFWLLFLSDRCSHIKGITVLQTKTKQEDILSKNSPVIIKPTTELLNFYWNVKAL